MHRANSSFYDVQLYRQMLPKLDTKKTGQEYYPKLQAANTSDETILKLKMIQQFLQEDSYTVRPTPLQHRKQFSLHSYRHVNQQNLKRYISNTSHEIQQQKAKKENIPPKQDIRARPQTKRQRIRLNELVETMNRQKGVQLFRKEVNLGNYKIL